MKKRVIAGMMALMVTCTACAQNGPTELKASEAGSEAIEAAEAAAEEASENNYDTEAAAVATEEAATEATEPETDDTAAVSPAPEEEEEPIEGLYGELLAGSEKVIFENTQFVNLDSDIAKAFENGRSYTVQEIIDKVKAASPGYDENIGEESFTGKLIDCGKDGDKELLLRIVLPGLGDERADEDEVYANLIVVKESEGKLLARFYTSDTHWLGTSIRKYGYLEASGPAYSGVGSEYAGYLDADVNWHLYYKLNYFLETADFANWQEIYYKTTVDITSEDWSNVYIEEYSFDEKGKDRYTEYTCYDGMLPKIYPEDYPADNPYKKTLEAAGLKACSGPEMEELLKKRRQEIGLTDEILDHALEEDEIIDALFRYNSIVYMDGTFHDIDTGEVETLDEFGKDISTDGTMVVDAAAYVDLDGKNGKELILYFTCGGGIYLILSTIDGEVYGTMMTYRCFEELQNNGTYMGSGGIADSYYIRLSIEKDSVSEEMFAEYHDGVLTVDGDVVEDADKWFSENFSDPAYFKEFKH